jgi:flagellar hook-associated protein 2
MTSVSALSSSAISSQVSTYETKLQAPITQLKAQITTDKADISAWGKVSGLSSIKNVGSINSKSATTSAATVATVAADNTAAAGNYNLTNVKLAKSQEIYSSLLGSGAASLSGGQGSLVFSLDSGKSETISVGSGSLTLNGVAAAINKQAGGVQASVIGTAAGARLVLQSSGTGSSAAFTVSGTGALSQFDFNPSSSTANSNEISAQSAADASLTLNGVPIVSASNTLSSAITGVTISLVGSGNAALAVSSAPTNLSNSVQGVATSLNAAISTIAAETKYTPASSASGSASSAVSGPLLGNFSATELKNELMTSVSGLAASGVSAGAVGLSINSAGAVSFNATSFASEYAKNPTAVQNLVTDLYKTLDSITTNAIGGSGSSTSSTGTAAKNTGFISAQTASLNGIITSIQSQITQLTKQDTAQIQNLINEYTIAETKASSASITQTYLNIFSSTSSSSG